MFFGGKIGCILKKWLHLGKSGSIRAKISCIRAKWLNSGKVVVFGQNMLFSGKFVVFGQN